MIIVDELKEGFNIMLHPKSATQKREKKSAKQLAFYYKNEYNTVDLIYNLIHNI